jgi:flagellar biosynthesis/type III secretory pathway M-ring protein FliF/YscJ
MTAQSVPGIIWAGAVLLWIAIVLAFLVRHGIRTYFREKRAHLRAMLTPDTPREQDEDKGEAK